MVNKVIEKEYEKIYPCDRCGSTHTVKHGTNVTISKGERPRRKCQSCGHTFYSNGEIK
jgi:transposase-like protein